MTIWRMRITGCISKATGTHLDYGMFVDFPLQIWLHESASMLRHTYIACLVVFPLYMVFSNNKVQM